MEIYDGPYFRINKKAMMIGGLWPYEENRAKKLTIQLGLGTFIIMVTLPQIYGFHKNLGVRLDKIFEHTAILLFLYAMFLKFMTPILAEKKLKSVFDSIAENWIDLKIPREREILMKYSKNGILLTKGYIAYMLMATAFYITLPLAPLLLNVVVPLNETRRPDFIFKGEFPVNDMRDHYIEIFVFDTLGCLVTVYTLIAVDAMYACCVEHCIGLFAIVKYRLEICTDHEDSPDRDIHYELIVEIIKLHTKTLAFADLLEETYSKFFLFIVGMNMLHLSLVCVIILIKQNEVIELIRYMGILGGIVTHLFYLSWPGQKLIDHSGGLFDDAYMNNWYKCSLKSKNLLKFMRLRCLKPRMLTAGGIYVMNFENFAAVIKTSGSYIAVFSSFTS